MDRLLNLISLIVPSTQRGVVRGDADRTGSCANLTWYVTYSDIISLKLRLFTPNFMTIPTC